MISGITSYNNRGQSFGSSASFAKKSINTAYKSIDVNSADYINYVYRLARGKCRQICEVNVESERLQNIVKDKEPCIFVMNHTWEQGKDINAAVFFNSLLYREYIYQNKTETCPRSKIMASKGFFMRAPDGGEQLRWLGVVPVNNSAKENRRVENAAMLKNITEQFARNEINLFLFPEGALAGLWFLPLKYKFQAGASYVIRKALEIKEKVKTVSLCFAHKKDLSAIHIGEPLYFSKRNGNYYATRGNVDSEFFDKKLSNLYDDKDEILLTEAGQSVGYKNVMPYISGILLDNMKCCAKEAKSDLKNSKPEVYTL